ncbi:MAG: metal-dependent hydrolase [Phycisphaerae bacterium]
MKSTITWFGHATVRLVLPDERVLMIDPWLAGNPACPDSLKKLSRCDIVVLTHGHGDHVSDMGDVIDAFDPIIVTNFDLATVLEKQLGKGRYSGMNTGGTQVVDDVHITLTQAFHSSGFHTDDTVIYAGMPNGAVIRVNGLAPVYHAGDTDVFGDMKLIARLFEPKVCILPIGDYFTMGAKGAALAADMLDPAAIIPIHYRTFPVLDQSADKFKSALSPKLQERLVVAEVGDPIPWTATGLG